MNKPKTIQTDCGIEKQCTFCQEYYPIAREFFYRSGKDKQGKTKYTAQCIDCYSANYKKGKSCKELNHA
ncbi:Uncharacterised protein [Moraxella atlantae]|uniref:Uncharacterized protein n=1 Tax=Faucicola atlantae TaxID=34059 RepID=A0A378Q4H6_9GAMM|nr:hypothetical protein B5J92_05940 [Moraxella atlantae]STY95088.1 Uncharacterised protein [Moraxella atlantae]